MKILIPIYYKVSKMCFIFIWRKILHKYLLVPIFAKIIFKQSPRYVAHIAVRMGIQSNLL